MPLEVGTQLGSYEILGTLGVGGMGEVYEARHVELDRKVAIKILPEVFAHDPERLARFEREAKLLASLNHPNIATLYGLERVEGLPFLVMELVEGPTLAERLVRGPMLLDEALPIFHQMADGLASAHAKGIVHRDLKPANVKLTRDGKVKILDFGLAKVWHDEQLEPTAGEFSQSPTITRGTAIGTILGTAFYMSPEQARGMPVDTRTDVWAFGCCLFEALSGRRPFDGETVSDVIGAILEREPDWGALPALSPPKKVVLRRLLEKDPAERLHSAVDASILLAEEDPRERRGGSLPVWKIAATAVAGLLALSFILRMTSTPRREPGAIVRFSIERPELAQPPTDRAIAIAPDETTIAWAGSEGRLYLRDLSSLEVRQAATNAFGPFFSPDGEWVGYFEPGRLMKVPTKGGTPQTLCSTDQYSGAAWGSDGNIYIGGFSLSSCPDSGGELQVVTTPEAVTLRHRWPSALPDGKGILFTEGVVGNWTNARIMLKPADEPPRALGPNGDGAFYVSGGHIVYSQAGVLMAVPFDLESLEVEGAAVPVLEGVMRETRNGATQFDVSPRGSLIYVQGSVEEMEKELVWVGRNGAEEVLPLEPRYYSQPRLSPDERRIALAIGTDDSAVWIYDIASESLTRLTFEGWNGFPAWTPDGSHVVFQSLNAGHSQVFWKPADGSGPAERVSQTDSFLAPHVITPDGSQLIVVGATAEKGTDIFVLDSSRKVTPFLATENNENSPVLSPDGRFLAYRSDESDRNEIYVQPFPATGAKWQISTNGGSEALWSRDGNEIFYRHGSEMMAVSVRTSPVFEASRSRKLFDGDYERTVPDRVNYDVTSDGRFLMVKTAGTRQTAGTLIVVLNWARELARIAPAE